MLVLQQILFDENLKFLSMHFKLGFRVSSRNSVARNCAELRATVLELREIVRNCEELRGIA